jgi:hypothetical protein
LDALCYLPPNHTKNYCKFIAISWKHY